MFVLDTTTENSRVLSSSLAGSPIALEIVVPSPVCVWFRVASLIFHSLVDGDCVGATVFRSCRFEQLSLRTETFQVLLKT